MARILQPLFLILFLLSGTLGYSYFGPASHTRFFIKQTWYRNHVLPFFDGVFSLNGEKTQLIAYLTSAQGDLSIRPPSELVFVPGREGQALYAGTLVSAGEESSAKITLIDNSTLSLEASSTILLEIPETTSADNSITLKVLKGTVAADKEDSSQTNVQIVTNKGLIRNVAAGKKTVVMSQRKDSLNIASLSKSAQISQLSKKDEEEFEELVGTVKDQTDLKVLEKQLFSDKSVISARVRAASQKVSAKTPEKEFDLEKLAQITAELEKELVVQESEDFETKRKSDEDKKKNPNEILAAIPAKISKKKNASDDMISALSPELLDELSKPLEKSAQSDLFAPAVSSESKLVDPGIIPTKNPKILSKKQQSEKDTIEEGEKSAALAEKIYSPDLDFSPELLKQAEALSKNVLKINVAPKSRNPSALGNLASEDFENDPNTEQLKMKILDPAKSAIKEQQFESSVLAEQSQIDKKKKKQLALHDSVALRGRMLTSYSSTGFSNSTQLAMDGLMGNFIQSEKCASALGTLKRVKRSYGQDQRAKSWITKWIPIYRSSCETGDEASEADSE